MALAVRQAVFDAILHGNADSARERPLTVPPSADPIAPAVLAAAQPDSRRADMHALYEGCLVHYRRVTRQWRRLAARTTGTKVSDDSPRH